MPTELRYLYVAHPLGYGLPTRELNRRKAAVWCAWLADRYYVAPLCTWITLAEVWPETKRDLGLEIDHALIELAPCVFACGGRLSEGMRIECGWARDVVDVTHFHAARPDSLVASEIEWIDEKLSRRGIRRRIDTPRMTMQQLTAPDPIEQELRELTEGVRATMRRAAIQRGVERAILLLAGATAAMVASMLAT